jgi:hypothetical protein
MAWGLRNGDAYTSERRDEAQSALLSEEICGRTTVVADVQIRKNGTCSLVSISSLGSGYIALSRGF